jgi:hypothetical protein
MQRNGIFISYSHKDGRHLERLKVHLKPVARELEIDVWDDTKIVGGAKWREDIKAAMARAKVAILLISADFLASDFITANELPPILAAAKAEGVQIFSVILSPCRFEQTKELASYQAINSSTKALVRLPVAEREALWLRVSNAVDAAFQDRSIQDSWRARNEHAIKEALVTLMDEEPNQGFVIASVGDYYVQYLTPESGALISEAVSNCFLKGKAEISPDSEKLLETMGFNTPEDNSSNFKRTDAITEPDKDLSRIARLSVDVLSYVYGVGERSNVTIERANFTDPGATV